MEWLSTDSDSESEGDLDELDEDPFGEDLGGLDDAGGFDDDTFDEFDDDGQVDQELENRIEELEEELGSLSSTVNTVRSENEEISETVHEIEENVRNLLDIYEMVTRGVNPFVDETQPQSEVDSGTFGLFETDDEQEEEDLDESVTDADAEEFFDDDFVDPDDQPDQLDGGLADGSDAPDGGLADGSEPDDGSESDDGGKSFDELKAEYESGEAAWDDPDQATAADSGVDEDPLTDDGSQSIPASDGGASDSTDQVVEASTDGPVDEPTDGVVETPTDGPVDEPTDGVVEASTDESLASTGTVTGNADSGQDASGRSAAGSRAVDRPARGETKPYLTAVPGGYACDLLVLEWMEYLVEEADPGDAARAIEYYESIDWLAEEAAEQLRAYLRGFGGEVETVEEPPEQLTMDHHTESLWYVSRLADGVPEALALDKRVERG